MNEYAYDINVIIINGAGANGKDSVVDYISETSGYLVSSVSIIEPVRHCANLLLSMTGDFSYDKKSNEYRKFLANIKTAWDEFNDGPFNHLKNILRDMVDTGNDDMIFVHIRNTDQIRRMRKFVMNELGCNCYTMLVAGRVDPDSYDNSEDAGVFDYNYNYIIMNKGDIEDLHDTVDEFLEDFKTNPVSNNEVIKYGD